MNNDILDKINEAKTSNILNIQNEIITNEIWNKIIILKKLEYLNLDKTALETIPPSISNLQNIRTLSFRDNKIKILPDELAKIKSENFKEFRITNNPIKSDFYYYITVPEKNSSKLKNILFDAFNNYQAVHGSKFISIKNSENRALIEIINKETNNILSFKIFIFGKENTKKSFLSELRYNIDNELKKQNIEFAISNQIIKQKAYSVRIFNYPYKKNKIIEIDYTKLLKYKKTRINMYFDETEEIKIPVSDLINYIGGINEISDEKKWNTFGKHLKEVEIINFKLFEQINFNLENKINIILGRNALGKTSILQAITLGLLPIYNSDKSNIFKEYINFNHSKNNVKSNHSTINLLWKDEERSVTLFENDFGENTYLGYPQQLLLSYGVNLNTNEKNEHSKITEQIISGNLDTYSTKSIFNDYSNDFYDPLIILQKLEIENNKQKNKNIAISVKTLKNTINEFLNLIETDERIILEQDFLNFYFKDINNNFLKTQNLSEGFKDHILLITDIIIRIFACRNKIFDNNPINNKKIFEQTNGVILIDEFDRHLHPIWQRNFLSKLKTTFPKIQFILTTHNPFSLQSAVGGTAHELLIKNNKIRIKSRKIEIENILSIINKFFTKDFFDYDTQKKLNLFSNYLDIINEGNLDFANTNDFRNIVKKLSDKGTEIEHIIASQLLQLNTTLRKNNKKEFEL